MHTEHFSSGYTIEKKLSLTSDGFPRLSHRNLIEGAKATKSQSALTVASYHRMPLTPSPQETIIGAHCYVGYIPPHMFSSSLTSSLPPLSPASTGHRHLAERGIPLASRMAADVCRRDDLVCLFFH